mmetsp:Transcript_16223/g.23691  ORF Transcript_16223/g.23691 Transcript_16223/m.23691 type:complete len:226 (-) Transcript_16223:102-779(-)
MASRDEDSKPAVSENMSTTPGRQSTGGSGSSTEFEPPLACVRRMLKNTLPTNTNVGKDACSAFSRACGIFIVYLTACANDFARENKRQTITANDILSAVKEIDFGEFSPALTAFIEQHRINEKKKKEIKKKNEEEAANNAKHDRDDDQSQPDDSSSPRSKRRKIDDAEVPDTPRDIGVPNEDMDDAEESLADASQDDAESQTNTIDQDEGDLNELNDNDDEDENK